MNISIIAPVQELAQSSVRDLVAAGRAAIEQAGSFEDVKAIAAQADALKAYQRSIGASGAAINAASELKVRAERRMGQALRDMEKAKGGRPPSTGETSIPEIEVSDRPLTIPEIGISHVQSARYQGLAEIPDQTFDAVVEAHHEAELPISAAAVSRAAEQIEVPIVPEDESPVVAKARAIAETHNHRAQGTGENEWYTPSEYIEAARRVLGSIDLDPASSEIANHTVQADRFLTIEDDGLSQEWSGSVWLNPPYAQPWIMRFAQKMVDEVSAGRAKNCIALTHNYTDTAWFHLAADRADAICFTRGRIGFLSPEGKKAAPTQGQAFFYYGSDIAAFASEFSKFGLVMVRHGV